MKKRIILTVAVATVAVLSVLIYNRASKEIAVKGCASVLEAPARLTLNQTAEPDKLKFVAVGDTAIYKEEDRNTKYETAKAIVDFCDKNGCDFVFFLGDNFTDDGIKDLNDPRIKDYHEKPFEGLKAPIYAILGNHDYRGDAKKFIEYGKVNPGWIMPDFSYTLDNKFAFFSIINSNCNIFGWMNAELPQDAQKSKWKFILSQHPIYSSGQHGNNEYQNLLYWDWKLKDKFDVSLSGHSHLLEYLKDGQNPEQYVISGAGADYYDAVGEKYDEKYPIDPKTEFRFWGNGFVYFQVTENQMKIEYIDKEKNILKTVDRIKGIK